MQKKFLCAAAAAVGLLWGSLGFSYGEMTVAVMAGDLEVNAEAAVVMDADSGRLLYAQNPDKRLANASTTKIMTALLTLEQPDQDRYFTVDSDAIQVEGTTMGLQPGDSVTLHQLAAGMLLPSGNDAANAAAVEIAGSEEAFVRLMNQRAAELGLENTQYRNPSGLDAEGHYSSAYDMALLARACLENEALAEIAATKSATVDGRVLTNHNKLLWQYEGCIGLKTGYTEKAGRTLVSAARRGGMTLIAVTLNDPDDWRDHTALLDYGFSTYAPVTLTEEGKAVARRPVFGSLVPFVEIQAAETVRIPVCEEDKIDWELQWDQEALEAPLRAGGSAGRMICRVNGEEAACVPLVFAQDVERTLQPPGGIWTRLMELWNR